MIADELRELLGERGAFELHRRGANLGDAEVVAEVLGRCPLRDRSGAPYPYLGDSVVRRRRGRL